MRIKLTLKQGRANQVIPINYQYALSSFIYNTIAASDSKYSKWLHETGFISGTKKFKMFTFSKLYLPKSQIVDLYEKKYLKIEGDKAELIVSMLSKKTIENFIIGMFENKILKIFDRNLESSFIIDTVEMIPEPVFREEMLFRTISPIVISKKSDHNGKNSETYLGPEDEDYEKYFVNNLTEKLTALMKNDNKTDVSFLGDTKINTDTNPIEYFRHTGNIKSKLITIKEDSKEESRVKAFYFGFKIKGNPALLKLGYEAGFGKSGSLGFGCAEIN
ncbi:MAG: CRISPR-associated endoribonuclease Cas6 [bacterium]